MITQWLKRNMGEGELNSSFRVANFLDLMSANEPISVTESVSQQDKYTVIDYRVVPKTDFRAISKGMTGPADIRVWIDKRTNLIARVEMTGTVDADGKKVKDHLAAGLYRLRHPHPHRAARNVTRATNRSFSSVGT